MRFGGGGQERAAQVRGGAAGAAASDECRAVDACVGEGLGCELEWGRSASRGGIWGSCAVVGRVVGVGGDGEAEARRGGIVEEVLGGGGDGVGVGGRFSVEAAAAAGNGGEGDGRGGLGAEVEVCRGLGGVEVGHAGPCEQCGEGAQRR